MGVKKLVKQVLTEKENQKYERLLKRRRVTYNDWLAGQEKSGKQEASERIREEAFPQADGEMRCASPEGDFVLIQAAKGSMASGAKEIIERYFAENPEVQVVYGDEDVRRKEGVYDFPWFKPDWSPDFLDSCLYFGSLTAVRRRRWEEQKSLYDRAYPGSWQTIFSDEEDGSCAVTDFAAYERWLHGCVDCGYAKGRGVVGHISRILFHGEIGRAHV